MLCTSEPSICQAKVGAGLAFFTTQFTSVLTPENQQDEKEKRKGCLCTSCFKGMVS
jgi:hypothetical protein